MFPLLHKWQFLTDSQDITISCTICLFKSFEEKGKAEKYVDWRQMEVCQTVVHYYNQNTRRLGFEVG